MRPIPGRIRICRLALAAIIAGTALSVQPASALIVFDPRNYAENLLSASRALEQINNQVASLRNEAQMLINQARNLTSLPTSMLGRIEGNFAEMKGLLGQAQRLAYNVQDIDQQFKDTYQNFGSNLTDRQLVDGARERWQGSVSAFEDALKTGAVAVGNIEGTRQQTTSLVDASQAAVGVLQATQAGNQLLAVQTSQIADLTAMLAAQGRANALESARRAAAQEQAREQFSRFMAGNSYSPASVKMFHD
ncbi:P-type conjugative transfer protein TrbJ [Mesorhizobium sp. VK22B]|uniref:P-type conjugative transfer protein TrbJ n=1 Tax=Mesorhizobium captivum TaxID=3072319 RepID=A0ABU4Z7Z8_9HYPH|nr:MULTISPECIES: P-type conjugative transfer protein TrbJ [unclassified Mesorhizobium]MDX8495093.1 P-type conjugative transfer protein TrbJ [Mesorhizobium sp. VK22B]MDX8505630.1 P-type conjugative transfer protein TrbJ [Mesorhizobium sp. VK22E]